MQIKFKKILKIPSFNYPNYIYKETEFSDKSWGIDVHNQVMGPEIDTIFNISSQQEEREEEKGNTGGKKRGNGYVKVKV